MKATILIGISGAGKSTYVTDKVKENSNLTVVSKDNIRKSLIKDYDSNKNLWDQYSFKDNEDSINSLFDIQLRKAAKDKQNIIIDNTNLSKSKNERLERLLKNYGYVEIDYVNFNLTDNINFYLENNQNRINTIPMRAINDQYLLAAQSGYLELSSNNNIALVDIDGTVAIKCDRSAFEYNKANNDTPNQYVIDTINALYETKRIDYIQFLSGRESYSYELTRAWLIKHGFDMNKHRLLMRRTSDYRRDSIIKNEIYESCLKQNNIKYLFDDRNQVVDMWWDNKLPVFHVGDYRNVF